MITLLDRWTKCKVNDVALTTDFVANGSFASLKENVSYLTEPSYAILVRLRDNNNGWNGNYVYVDKHAYEFLAKSALEPGDIVVSNVGDPGQVFRVPALNMPMTLGPNSILVRPVSEDIDKGFLAYLLESPHGQSLIHQIITATAQRKFNKTDFRKLDIPIAPASEQKRIAAKLEKLLAKVDQCKERLEKIRAILKRFRQSVLGLAFNGDLTNNFRGVKLGKRATDGLANDGLLFKEIPTTWEVVKFRNLISDGPKNGLYKPQSYYGSGVSIVRIDNFYEGEIEAWKNLKKLQLTVKERKDFALENKDILINRVNSMPFLGKSALVRDLDEECVFESNMMRIRLNEEIAHPEYLIKYLNCPLGLRELRKNAKHAVNQSSINQQDVQDALVILPDIAEQTEIVQRVESLFEIANKIESRYEKAKAHVDKLTKSILAKAFRGELVPQDPNDEPASELLKRIKAEKAEQEAQEKKKRGTKPRTRKSNKT